MQHEGRGKATKVDKNVAKWTKICRSTVYEADKNIIGYKVALDTELAQGYPKKE